MKLKPTALSIIVAATLTGVACSSKADNSQPLTEVKAAPSLPSASADSLYSYVKAQVNFGPRVPGTKGHEACIEYIKNHLTQAGASVAVQDTLFAPPTTKIAAQRVRNIIGRFNPDARRQILLLAHYDTRPWADEDANTANHSTPIDGANDGGSGVAVLLEVARLAQQLPSNIGITLLFADAEDAGNHNDDFSWCIGSQAWAHRYSQSPQHYDFAILLDMVGGNNATFCREYFSETYAKQVNDRVWKAAANLGYSSRFINEVYGAVNDDHVPLLNVGIPTIDIIEAANPQTGSFNPTWHTLADNIDNIDPATLKIVTDVILSTITN